MKDSKVSAELQAEREKVGECVLLQVIYSLEGSIANSKENANAYPSDRDFWNGRADGLSQAVAILKNINH